MEIRVLYNHGNDISPSSQNQAMNFSMFLPLISELIGGDNREKIATITSVRKIWCMVFWLNFISPRDIFKS
jgi:hypothetical protein